MEVSKSIAVWLICHLVGIIVFSICCIKYSVDPKRIAIYVAMATESSTAIIFLFETARIIFLIGTPSLLTSKLRTVLLLIIMTWALQGPAMNATNNIRSSVEGVACVQLRVQALAEEIREHANHKLQQIPLEDAQELITKSMKPFKKITKMLKKIDETISKVLEWQKNIIKKMKGIFVSCSELSRMPYNLCINKLDDLYYSCLDNTFEFICEPILFLKKQCYMTRFMVPVCDWPSKMKKTLEENAATYVKDGVHKAMDLAKNTTFYKVVAKGKNMAVGVKDAYKTMNFTVKHKFAVEQKMNVQVNEFKAKLRSEVVLLEKFLHFSIMFADFIIYPIMMLPFFTAILYVIKFNRLDTMDNYFLTKEFDGIDKQRKKIHEPSIFPLSKDEAKTYIRAFSWRISSKEKMKLVLKIAMTIMGIMIPLMFVLVDIMTYTILDTGYEFFHSNFTQVLKPNVYQLKVSGTGFLNSLLSNILEVFQPVNKMTEKKDNLWRGCFEEPSPPKYKTFKLMFALFMFAILTCLLEVYVRRFRHLIAEYYFPKRKQFRALFLHNEIREKRKNVLSETLKMATERLLMKKKKNETKNQNEEPKVQIGEIKNQCFKCARTELKLTAAG
uniref:Dendritic cell-specific transmembrane protein-like domain-containing protein n=1 Tax=Panagrolaimus sp. JU765 TaxID=591449 RepID=A0AC34RA59_9BILA